MKNVKRIAAVCAAVMFVFAGCGKKQESGRIAEIDENDTTPRYDEYFEGETQEPVVVEGEYGNEISNDEDSITCQAVGIREEGTTFEDTGTQIVIVDLKITNNSDEFIAPNSLSYFTVKDKDGNVLAGTSLRAQMVAAEEDSTAYFDGGIKSGETKESDVYIEIPKEYEELTFEYCPYTYASSGYAPLALSFTFTSDDVTAKE